MNVLILLIGGNPLPNYIVSKYLLTPERHDLQDLPRPDRILLVYSEQTNRFKKSIEKAIKEMDKASDLIVKAVSLGKEPRDPLRIVEGIQKQLVKFAEGGTISSIHLTYTGGTKSMSVYSSLTVFVNWLQAIYDLHQKNTIPGKHVTLLLSDVDPNPAWNRLQVLKQIPEKHLLNQTPLNVNSFLTNYPPQDSEKADLREHVSLSVEKLLKLHKMTIREKGVADLTLPAEELQQFAAAAIPRYETSAKKKIFRIFFEREAHEDYPPFNIYKKERKDQEEIFKKRTGLFKGDRFFKQIAPLFPVLAQYSHGFSHQKGEEYLSFIEFFNGKWLEELVLSCLLKLKERWPELGIGDIRKGVEAAFDGRPTEIDVIAMRGYQMFLFSCTTSQDIKTVKQKAFEGLYRADELGGEHAKTIMVSPMYPHEINGNRFSKEHNLERLKRDLHQFDARRNCSLLGFEWLMQCVQDEDEALEALYTILNEGRVDPI